VGRIVPVSARRVATGIDAGVLCLRWQPIYMDQLWVHGVEQTGLEYACVVGRDGTPLVSVYSGPKHPQRVTACSVPPISDLVNHCQLLISEVTGEKDDQLDVKGL
jgi:hypothetical protein